MLHAIVSATTVFTISVLLTMMFFDMGVAMRNIVNITAILE